MRRKVVLTVALVFCLANYAQATLSIVVPTITVTDPGFNPASIIIDILVTNDGDPEQAAGGDLHAQIGVNRPGPAAPNGNPPSPTIAALIAANTFTDSFFNFAANGAFVSEQSTNNWNVNKAINTNLVGPTVQTVEAAGLFVHLKIDYSGLHSGSWPIILSPAGVNGPTDIYGIDYHDFPLSITDGMITITAAAPEPASLVLGWLAAAGLGIVAIRKRRSRFA